MTADSHAHRVTKQNRSLPDTICILLVCSMMGCVALSIAQVGARLDSSWNGSYLAGLAVLVSLEALLTTRLFTDYPFLSPEWMLYRGVEWVVLLIGMTLFIYAWHLPGQLLRNLPAGGNPFSFEFINLDVVVGVVTGLVIWVLSTQYGSALFLLEYDPDRLDTEREGIGMLDRWQVRKQIMALIFTVGGLMIVLTAFQRVDLTEFRLREPAADPRRWILLVYFLLGLILLGITNFSALRSRWYIQKVPLASNLSRRWIVFSAILLSLISVMAILLPTRYAVDILALINILISILAAILGFLYLLLLSPLLYLFNQLLRLLRPSPVESEPANPFLPFMPPPASNEPPIPWLDFLRSALFWVLLIGVISFSLYHYLDQRKGWVDGLRKVSVAGWLINLWNWFLQGIKKANRQFTAILVEAAQKTVGYIQSRRSKRFSIGPAPMTPKDRVIHTYQSMVHYNQDTGVPRQSHQTPQEYGRILQEAIPDIKPDIDAITGTFMEARYSQHAITPEQANRAVDWVENIRSAVDEWMKRTNKDAP